MFLGKFLCLVMFNFVMNAFSALSACIHCFIILFTLLICFPNSVVDAYFIRKFRIYAFLQHLV